MANTLLQLDHTSEDTLYSFTNDWKPWSSSGAKHHDFMHVNVTADNHSPPPHKRLNDCNSSRHPRYEPPSPFPYNSSLNYYYNKSIDPIITTENQDPFIDTHSEIVRAKVTCITRAMQQCHINELEPTSSLPCTSSRPLSPLSILCPTTNSLIKSRAMEEEQQDDTDERLWQQEFLHLMSGLITYSENLETISTELLWTEGKVRELVLLQKSMMEEYEERERMYRDRLEECQQVADQQQRLMEYLNELDNDLYLACNEEEKTSKRRSLMTTLSRATTAAASTTTLSTVYRWQSSEQSQSGKKRSSFLSDNTYATSITRKEEGEGSHAWDTSQRISDIVRIKSMEDMVHTLRWEVGVWIGGGVGTGHVIHSFEGPLHGIELIIAGSGTIATLAEPHLTPTTTTLEQQMQKIKSHTQSSSIHHLHFHRHHYMLHISAKDRKTRFRLLPNNLWTPDKQADQCQFKTCSTKFTFFQRRHHCRRCGLVICQRHSLNRLPLFSNDSRKEKWHRVCDGCFYDLIIASNNNNNKRQQVSHHDSATDLTEVISSSSSH